MLNIKIINKILYFKKNYDIKIVIKSNYITNKNFNFYIGSNF